MAFGHIGGAVSAAHLVFDRDSQAVRSLSAGMAEGRGQCLHRKQTTRSRKSCCQHPPGERLTLGTDALNRSAGALPPRGPQHHGAHDQSAGARAGDALYAVSPASPTVMQTCADVMKQAHPGGGP